MAPKLLWACFFSISIGAVWANWSENLWSYRGPISLGKYALWISFAAFVAYGLYATRRESFVKSVKKIGQLYWGRQIGIDLYIGFAFFICLIGFHQNPLAALIWSIPILVYGNQLSLLYLAIHYDSILQKFL